MNKKRVKKVEQEENVSLASLLGMEEDVPQAPIEEEKPKKLTPFDFLNSITYTKECLIVDEATERQYNPYLVNLGLSFSADTVIYANEMNARSDMSKRAQYEFLLRIVPKRKRYDKWIKAEKLDELELVKEYYGFNDTKALAALRILTAENLDYIKDKMTKGGINK